MNCPSEIAEVVLEIIKTAALRIRSAGWARDANRCAIEADHIHNLPDLLRCFSPELLKFYWEVEKASFVGQTSADDSAPFEPLWSKLAVHVTSHSNGS